jgi:hypothetical protein
MKHVFICVLWLNAVHAVAQQSDAELKKAFEKLTLGTSMENVKATVGSPTRVEPFKLIMTQTGDTAICWYYAVNDWTLLFTNKYLNRVIKDRDTFLLKLQEWSNPKNQDGIRILYGK